MKLKLLIAAALAVLTLQAAGSFSLDATYTFTPLSGSLPTPHASSVRAVMVATPSSAWTYDGNGNVVPSSFYTYLDDNGAPTASESTSTTNAINTSQITWAPSGYGLSTTGSFTDLSTAQVGFGSLTYSNTVFDANGMAGTVALDFDCQLSTAGANEAAVCIVYTAVQTQGGTNHVSMTPTAIIMDLRGSGTARWNDGVITASGSNYTLRIGFNSPDNSVAQGQQPRASTGPTSTIVVSGGVVASATKSALPNDPFVLPTVGSSGSITITAPVPSVTYDYRTQAGSDPTQLAVLLSPGGCVPVLIKVVALREDLRVQFEIRRSFRCLASWSSAHAK